MPVYEVEIEPMEPLLFGDNRSARAGVDHLQLDQDPSPLTLFGAIGQLLIDRFGPWPHELLGARRDDILAARGGDATAELLGFCHHNAAREPMFPRPRHLRCEKGRHGLEVLDLLTPREIAGGRISWQDEYPRALQPDPDEFAPDEPVEEHEGEVLVNETALGEVLCHRLPDEGVELCGPEALYRAEARPGISVDNDSGTVFEGRFFTRPYRRFQPPAIDPGQSQGGFTAWYQTLAPLPEDLAGVVGFVGGDRRRARFQFSPRGTEVPGEALSALREEVVEVAREEESAGFFLYLLTPLIQDGKPPLAEGRRPVAAAFGPPRHISGWDVKRNCPRPIQALIPAGSTFFYEWPEDLQPDAKAAWVERGWLGALQEAGAAAGFGRCLVGVWR